MKITIVGAGAMGSLMAARLTLGMQSHSTEPNAAPELSRVLLYGREGAHLQAIRDHGLELTERDGQVARVQLDVTSDPAEVAGSDVVIVFVKSWATTEATAPLMPYLTRSTIVITLQNGLGNVGALRESLRRPDGTRPHVWLGVTTQAALRTAPGKVLHTSDGVTAFGRIELKMTEEMGAVALALRDNGWRTQAVEDVHRWVWRKLAINAAVNPLTALAGVPNAAIATDNDLKQAAYAVIDEVIAVATAQGVRLNRDQIIQTMDAVARHPGNPFSSMYDDLAAGNQTEVDAINGAIVRFGRRSNIPTPVNTMILRLIQAKVRAAQGVGDTPAISRPSWAPQA